MMTMLKKVLCLMVSCVFISMVCIPSAHADDTTGSITLDVQSAPDNSVQALNDDAPVNGLKKQSSMNDVKCRRNATYHVKYETWKGLKRGTLTYGVYVLNAITCGPIKNAKVNLFSTRGETNANGYAEITGYAGMYVSDSDNTWTQVYEPIGLYPLRHYYTPESSNNNVNCMISERNEVKDCKGNTLTYNNYYIDGNGLIGAILLYPDSSDPPEPVLTSFPITGKYALTIVISLVLIAGISMVFIHSYGRKYHG